MVKVVVNNGQYKITIPREIALAKGWTKNTRVLVSMDESGNVVLRELSKK
jgi:bifunctional DNA-binding transcriptional regulator/antitoxin component of YhaV-PrlF toxin-antitoxin module|tara:strand:- start:711 stop:860 length:150 start_codon:yes stop_codon:yes gene_type:complete